MKNLERFCPVCNNHTGEVLHKQLFTLPFSSPLPKEYDVVSCEKCGFCFADVNASQETYDLYYKKMSKYEDKNTGSGGALNNIDRKRLFAAAEIISNTCTNQGASILDIGCANGGLLSCLKQFGFSNLTGIDISQTCVNNVKELGFNAFFGGIFNLDNIQNLKFDIVILSHVLEHVKDLAKGVEIIESLIHDDGHVYIEVPDASRYSKYYIVPYYYFDCEHINHLDADSLINIFEDNNFKCISIAEREIPVSEGTHYPAVSAIFRKTVLHENSFKLNVKRSFKVRDSIIEYINMSKQASNNVTLSSLAEKKSEVLVWGAGMYTSRLLNNSQLGKCNIISFLDKDSNKQGNMINDIIIQDPQKVLPHNNTAIIIVASALYGQDIEKEIRSIDGNENRIVIVL